MKTQQKQENLTRTKNNFKKYQIFSLSIYDYIIKII